MAGEVCSPCGSQSAKARGISVPVSLKDTNPLHDPTFSPYRLHLLPKHHLVAKASTHEPWKTCSRQTLLTCRGVEISSLIRSFRETFIGKWDRQTKR